MYPAFDKFSDFIEREAKLACDPVTSFQSLKKVQEPATGDNKKGTRKDKKQTFLSKTINKDGSKKENTSKGQSDTKSQQDFKSPAEGQKLERKRRPCFMCNEDHHTIIVLNFSRIPWRVVANMLLQTSCVTVASTRIIWQRSVNIKGGVKYAVSHTPPLFTMTNGKRKRTLRKRLKSKKLLVMLQELQMATKSQ